MPAYSIPFPNSPIDGKACYLSREWYLFLSSMFQSVGGPVITSGGGIAPVDVQKQFEDYPMPPTDGTDALRFVDELRNATDRDQSPLIRELVAAIDDLRNELSLSRNDAATLRNRVELIEDRLA